MPKKRMLIGGAAIALAMALVGVGVYAAFTDTETSNVAIDTGQLDISGADDITVTDMAPGDVAYRDMTIVLDDDFNDGDLIEFIDVETALDTDTVGVPTDDGDEEADTGESLWSGTNGIDARLAVCAGGTWTMPAEDDPLLGDGVDADTLDDSVVCTGGTVVEQTAQNLNTFAFTDSLDAADFGETATGTGTIPDGSELELLFEFALPSDADNSYENASVTFDIVFDAIQRDGVNK